MTVMTSITAL